MKKTIYKYVGVVSVPVFLEESTKYRQCVRELYAIPNFYEYSDR